MPPFAATSLNNKINLLTPGQNAYCYGSFDDRSAQTRMTVTNVSLTTNVATLTVTVLEGNIPAVGSLISTRAIPNNSGAFNVTNSTLTGVTIDGTSGTGTVTFALTHADVVSAGASGEAIVETPENSEVIVNGSSIAWCLPMQPSQLNQGRAITAVVGYPAPPTTARVDLQENAGPNPFDDSAYVTLGTVSSVAASVVSPFNPNNFTQTVVCGRFYRLHVSTLAGSGTIIGKLLA